MSTEFVQSSFSILAFILPGHSEWIILLVLGLLIFGRRLPEVGRNIGRSIVEFKRGIKGVTDEIEEESAKSPPSQISDTSSKESLPDTSQSSNSDSVGTAESGNSEVAGNSGIH